MSITTSEVPEVEPSGRTPPLVRGLIRLAGAYRVWSLGVFAVALIELIAVGDVRSCFLAVLVLIPFGAALAVACRSREYTSPWIVAFLVLVDFGVIIAPLHQVLPWLNLFPELGRAENRILTWYFLVNGVLQFVIAPPVAFARSLRTARRGGTPTLGVGICLAGFAVWGLLVGVISLIIAQR